MLPPAYTARETTDVRGMDQCSEQITFYTDMEPLLPNGQPNPDFGTRQFREESLCGLTLTLTLTLSLTLTLILTLTLTLTLTQALRAVHALRLARRRALARAARPAHGRDGRPLDVLPQPAALAAAVDPLAAREPVRR